MKHDSTKASRGFFLASPEIIKKDIKKDKKKKKRKKKTNGARKKFEKIRRIKKSVKKEGAEE